MKTILLGNGLNRLTYGNSWGNLVHAIDEESKKIDSETFLVESQIPNTHQFNAKALKEMLVNNDLKLTMNDSEKKLKGIIKNEMKNYLPCHLHDMLIQMNPDHIVTTNYDDVVDKAILRNKNFSYIKSSDPYQEQKYSIRRCRNYWNVNQRMTTWNIHGELGYINSIMLGYDHYCNTIELIDDYLDGKYKYHKRLLKEKPMKDKVLQDNTNILSWIDLFFFSDIHILGLGLGYEELDLWYVIMKRRKMQLELGQKHINNHLFYYENVIGKGKKELMKLYGLEIISTDVKPKDNDFTPVYESFIEKMHEYIK